MYPTYINPYNVFQQNQQYIEGYYKELWTDITENSSSHRLLVFHQVWENYKSEYLGAIGINS
ncbi:hypothetical protein CUU66_23310 [Peribacillus deserti]|uniref:Uncharacterized protein n=1 Tax=Peribacillus deserti TaxID=673318 RepID=A0A2N5LZJ7_9BACI|nr:hypothetical protein CUU66_23310 [Peribacillus deserti]